MAQIIDNAPERARRDPSGQAITPACGAALHGLQHSRRRRQGCLQKTSIFAKNTHRFFRDEEYFLNSSAPAGGGDVAGAPVKFCALRRSGL
jgi:hypothetical protein